MVENLADDSENQCAVFCLLIHGTLALIDFEGPSLLTFSLWGLCHTHGICSPVAPWMKG